MKIGQISIVMPVYNAARFVVQAIRSIQNQTFGNYEFIIVDDCSTDGSYKIIEEMAKADARIKVLRNARNCGVARTLNVGFGVAKGSWVARMDADDIAHVSRFEEQINRLEQEKELVLLGSDVVLIDVWGRKLKAKTNFPLVHDEIRRYLNLGGWPIVHPTVMIRKDAFDQIGGYDPSIAAEDHVLFSKLSDIGRVANMPAKLLSYRLSPNSVMAQWQRFPLKLPLAERQKLATAEKAPLTIIRPRLYLVRTLSRAILKLLCFQKYSVSDVCGYGGMFWARLKRIFR